MRFAFFFSSRRRHTTWTGDWSSDVCSSDLVAEAHEDTGAGRGGSSAMPHKQNPVAAVLVLGCARQAPALLATLAAAAEQEHQRAAGAWHSEWQPLSHLLTLTGAATSWAAEMLTTLDASNGLPMAENLTRLLAPALGRLAAHDLIAQASLRATSDNIDLAA